MKNKLVIGLVLVGLGGLIYVGPDLYRHFGVRYEDSRRHIYEKNISYVRGTIEHVERLKYEYETADEGHKPIVKQTILASVASFDVMKLPLHVREFGYRLRSNR